MTMDISTTPFAIHAGVSRPAQADNPAQYPEDALLADPAPLIALAIRFGVMGRVRREGVPAPVRDGLRRHADAGEPACAMVLAWLDRLVCDDLEAASSPPARLPLR
ncbi:hypothetical protein [Pelagibacterium halotolerans]|uniref:hypothetical protein n=1 Tax=Pelagibacterium halotolerans TaxID=531813 RepID=UPI00384C85FC